MALQGKALCNIFVKLGIYTLYPTNLVSSLFLHNCEVFELFCPQLESSKIVPFCMVLLQSYGELHATTAVNSSSGQS